jgi:hypothetical protein
MARNNRGGPRFPTARPKAARQLQKDIRATTRELCAKAEAAGYDAKSLGFAVELGGQAAGLLLTDRGVRSAGAVVATYESESGMQLSVALAQAFLPGGLSRNAFDLGCASVAAAVLLNPAQVSGLAVNLPAIMRLEAADLAVLEQLIDQVARRRDAESPTLVQCNGESFERLRRVGLVAVEQATEEGRCLVLALAKVRAVHSPRTS